MADTTGAAMIDIPAYIEERLRRPAPDGCYVVPGSTPVISFGDASRARVATVGINPSMNEFQNQDRIELTGAERRLATHRSLGYSDLTSAPVSAIRQAWADSNGYFHRRPYLRWFNQLEQILIACGASYYDGSACSLDLVQWATDSRWGVLPEQVRGRLLETDTPFLKRQLVQAPHIKLVLANGMAVADQLEQMGFPIGFPSYHVNTIVQLDDKAGPIVLYDKRGNVIQGRARPTFDRIHQGVEVFHGTMDGRVFIGWNLNLQSSHLTRKVKAALASRVAELYHSACP